MIADSLQLGVSGFIVSMIHLAPRPFTAIYQAVRAGEYARAVTIQESINQAMKLVRGSIERRPESSTLFHVLNYALRQRGVCENVLLDHEGEAPAWLIENARRAYEWCMEAV